MAEKISGIKEVAAAIALVCNSLTVLIAAATLAIVAVF